MQGGFRTHDLLITSLALDRCAGATILMFNLNFVQICDVCDDREQLVAVFEEQPRSGLKGDHLGDGMSSEDSSDSKEKEPSGDPSNHGMDIYEGSLALQVGLCHCLRSRNLISCSTIILFKHCIAWYLFITLTKLSDKW